jgi:hypothetical protein
MIEAIILFTLFIGCVRFWLWAWHWRPRLRITEKRDH